jgi:uncharacterized protein (TIGR02569 family)
MVIERYANSGAPSEEVLHAFGATQIPIPLAGGQRQNYRSGQFVFKPARDNEETDWIAEFYLSAPSKSFRLPQPIRINTGGFVYKGWQAWCYIEGQPGKGRWKEIVDICIQFHQEIAGVPKPDYFPRREQNPWVIADKVTWRELAYDHHPRIAPAVEQLLHYLCSVDDQCQLVHGDFGGNVLFAEGLPPAIIDFSPYWRPLPFAVGVVIADAIVWEGADISLIEAGSKLENFYQHLARAELRRIIELETLYSMYGWSMLREIDAHLPLINVICELCGV